jgi:hypothetical protein
MFCFPLSWHMLLPWFWSADTCWWKVTVTVPYDGTMISDNVTASHPRVSYDLLP